MRKRFDACKRNPAAEYRMPRLGSTPLPEIRDRTIFGVPGVSPASVRYSHRTAARSSRWGHVSGRLQCGGEIARGSTDALIRDLDGRASCNYRPAGVARAGAKIDYVELPFPARGRTQSTVNVKSAAG